jgi:hypothetical protein
MFLRSENLKLDVRVRPAACDFVIAEIALEERMARAQFLRLMFLATVHIIDSSLVGGKEKTNRLKGTNAIDQR